MKHLYFSKYAIAVLLSSMLLLIFSACSQNGSSSSISASPAISSDEPASSQTLSEPPSHPSASTSVAENQTSSEPSSQPSASLSAAENQTSSVESSSEATLKDTSPLSAYQSVLQNAAEFFSTDANENLKISQLNQVISSEVTVEVTNFTVIDMGNVGTPAVILSLNVNGNSYGVEVLSYQDGIVYGYTFSGRQFGDLRTDGTFVASGGASDVGICTITFDKNTYSIDKFTYCESNTDSENNTSESYVVNHQSATEDEYNAAFSQWQTIPNVTWYDYTAENISAQLSAAFSNLEAAWSNNIINVNATANEYQFEVNDNDTVTITKYTGSGGDVEIPAEIDEKKVTAIGNTSKGTGAFQDCTTLTSVIIPDGVTEIQDNAFQGCTSLKTVTIPASVTVLRNCAFDNCPDLYSVYFEGNAPQTANDAFTAEPYLMIYYHKGASGWTDLWYGLTTRTYLESGEYYFKVNDDSTVTITKYIGKGGDVVIPTEIDGKNVTAIGNTFQSAGAFQDCTTLTSVIIPDGVTEIQDNAFQSCTSLKTVTIPASVTILRNCAFDGCSNLQSVYFEGDAPVIANYVFVSRSPELIFYYHEGTSGWTNPWHSIPVETY